MARIEHIYRVGRWAAYLFVQNDSGGFRPFDVIPSQSIKANKGLKPLRGIQKYNRPDVNYL